MTEPPPVPPARPGDERGVSGTAVLGALLILAGVAFFIGQQLDIAWQGEIWPLYVVGAGVALAAFGLVQPGGSGLTIAGSITAVVGGILFYQEAANHYESWAYVWPLAAPGGSGLGMLLHGLRFGSGRLIRDGAWQVVLAFGILAVGFVFFEGFIGLSGDRWNLPAWVGPALLIGLGAVVLILAFTGRRSTDATPPDAPPAA